MNVLYTWLGNTDLHVMKSEQSSEDKGEGKGKGPVADAIRYLVKCERLNCVVLLADYNTDDELQSRKDYCEWLEGQLSIWLDKRLDENVKVIPCLVKKGDPTDFNWAYDALQKAVSDNESDQVASQRHYLVGPGTPTMATCTIILSRLHQGKLWQADYKHLNGCRKLELPFLILKVGPDPASYAADRAPGAQVEARAYSGEAIVCSPSTVRAWHLAKKAASSDWPVLILGATGSGKEGLVKYLHACGPRSANKIITKNCGAFPDDLIESELFGYIKGAFTGANKEGRMGAFEEAQDSTLFLDEVGELSLNAQTRLLRVLQEKEITRVGDHIKNSIKVNCRIVAATHRNLWQSVQEGRFRADLYYRLAGLIITLDDLSKRPEDLVRMIDRFWQETVDVNPGFPGRTLSDDARRRLLAHNWPGNVRELIGALVRIAFLAKKPEVTAEDVELSLAGVESAEANISIQQLTTESLSSPKTSAPPGLNLKEQLKNYQRQLIEEAITRAEGNKSGAARELGVSYQHLNRLLKD